MRELHQIGEYCWSDADGACVRDRLLGRLLDDSVVIGVIIIIIIMAGMAVF